MYNLGRMWENREWIAEVRRSYRSIYELVYVSFHDWIISVDKIAKVHSLPLRYGSQDAILFMIELT